MARGTGMTEGQLLMKTDLLHRLGASVLLLAALAGCSPTEEPLGFSGPYLGQPPPGSEPRLFLPGVVSTNNIDDCVGILEEGRVCVFSIRDKGTFSMFMENGRWSRPAEVPWKNERGTTDFTVGPDGRTVYFQSYRFTGPGDEKREGNSWVVEWTGGGWTEPFPLPPPVNTEEYSEWYPSAAPDGTVYFFSTTRPDSKNGDIYRSRFRDGVYLDVELLPAPVNSDYYEVDPVISPDGNYLLFGSGRPGGYGLLDLYVSFLTTDGRWTPPVNAGPGLNPFSIPTRMSVTPDGKYYFFPSRSETEVWKGEEVVNPDIERWGDVDVYWVDTTFVSKLMARNLGKESAASMVARDYRVHGIRSATTLLARLHNEERDDLVFELSEFMVFLGDLLREGQDSEAEQLYQALLRTIPEDFRIRQGYAMTCIMNGRTREGSDLLHEAWKRHPSLRPVDDFMIPFQLRMMGRTDDELAMLRFLVSERPESVYANFDLVQALERGGRIQEALEYCKKVLELNPSFEDAVRMREKLTHS
jgi:hypothetical protein